MTTDEKGRVRVRLMHTDPGDPTGYGWATSAPASETDPAGYTIEWDDGYVDEPSTRWHFEGDGIFDLEHA